MSIRCGVFIKNGLRVDLSSRLKKLFGTDDETTRS